MGLTSMKDLEARLEKECSECILTLREIVDCLRNVAAGLDDVEPTAHSTDGGGWGFTYKRATTGKVFCQLHPKPNAKHVGADIRGADESKLKEAGKVHLRKNVTVQALTGVSAAAT